MSSLRRRLALLLAFVAAAGVVTASATSVGGLAADQLGAEVAVVASCDGDGVAATFTTAYQVASPGYYRITQVNVTGIAAACIGQAISVTVLGPADVPMGQGTATVTGSATTVAVTPILPALTIDSRTALGASIVIAGQ